MYTFEIPTMAQQIETIYNENDRKTAFDKIERLKLHMVGEHLRMVDMTSPFLFEIGVVESVWSDGVNVRFKTGVVGVVWSRIVGNKIRS